MSMDRLQADLLASLESALDVRKVLSVFTTIMGVLRDQQLKLDKQEKTIHELSTRPVPQPPKESGGGVSVNEFRARIAELENKLEDVIQSIQGNDQDSSILQMQELTGYSAFEQSSAFARSLTPQKSIRAKSRGLDMAGQIAGVAEKFKKEEDEEEELIEPEPPIEVDAITKEQSPRPIVNQETAPVKKEQKPKVTEKAKKQELPPKIVKKQPSVKVIEDTVPEKEVVASARKEKVATPKAATARDEVVDTKTEEEPPTTTTDQAQQEQKQEQDEPQQKQQEEKIKEEVVELVKVEEPVVVEEEVVQEAAQTQDEPVVVLKEPTPRVSARIEEKPPVQEPPREEPVKIDEEIVPIKQLKTRADIRDSIPRLNIEQQQQAIAAAGLNKDEENDQPGSPIISRPTTSGNAVGTSANNVLPQSSRRMTPKNNSILTARKTTIETSRGGNGRSVTMVSARPQLTARVELNDIRRMSKDGTSTIALNIIQDMPVVVIKRKKMDVSNLPFLTPSRVQRIIKELKRRGKFIQLTRHMMEDARKKYATKSLKQRVDYLEAEMQRAKQQINKLREVAKKTVLAVRESKTVVNPYGEQLVTPIELLLKIIDDHGGLDTFSKNIRFIQDIEEGKVAVPVMINRGNTSARGDAASSSVSDDSVQKIDKGVLMQLKEELIQEQQQKMLVEIKKSAEEMRKLMENTMTSKEDLQNMLSPGGSSASTSINGGSFGPGTLQQTPSTSNLIRQRPTLMNNGLLPGVVGRQADANHLRLMSLINNAINVVHDRINTLENEKLATIMKIVESRQGMLMGGGGMGDGSNIDKQLLDMIMNRAQGFIEERINLMQRAFDQRLHEMENKKLEMVDDISVLGQRMLHIEAYIRAHHMSTGGEESINFKKEVTAIRELQRRVAKIPIDKMLDDIRFIQKDLRLKPSTNEVNDMIESIEGAFKEIMGENVVGMKSLVYEVYRHIQHKVDKDDIRKLITSKLAQMEKEIVKREEEMLHVASVTRCLSCGQFRDATVKSPNKPRITPNANNNVRYNLSNNPTNTTNNNSNNNGGSSNSSQSKSIVLPTAGTTNTIVMDDELSQASNDSNHHHHHHHQHNIPVAYSSSNAEQVYTLLTGQAGLKPLQLQHPPLLPVKDPYVGQEEEGTFLSSMTGPLANHNSSIASNGNGTVRPSTTIATTGNNKQRKASGVKLPEPLYRKAKVSAAVKEMVKVSAAAADNYGFSSNNPLYVLDGGGSAVLQETDAPISLHQHSFMQKSNTGNGGNKLSSSGKLAINSNSTTLPDIHNPGDGMLVSSSMAKLNNTYL